jgi:hypothetical protein
LQSTIQGLAVVVFVVVQGAVCLVALRWPTHCQKRLMFVFIIYHIVLCVERLYVRSLGEDPMPDVLYLHAAMVVILVPIVAIAWKNYYKAKST